MCSRADTDRHARSTRGGNRLRVQLELPSAADSVTLVRSLTRTLARASDVDEALIDDVCTAVSEACTNVVLHAYAAGCEGSMDVSLEIDERLIEVTVRDHGRGMHPGRSERAGLGLGLVLIGALADRVTLESDAARGTELQLTFRRRPAAVPSRLVRLRLGVWELSDPGRSGDLRVRSG